MYEEITIKQFEVGYFKKDYSVFTKEQIEESYTEYIDTAGLFETEEFQKVTYIHYLNNRLNSVKLSVKLQKEFLSEFGVPFVPELQFLKKFGHRIYWDDKKGAENFIEQLDKCVSRDNKYVSILESKIKELTQTRAKNINKERTVEQSRGSWIRTVNTLGKIFSIDKDKTTLEEYSYMIKQQTEDNKKQ